MTDPYQQTIDVLARCKRVLITTHVRPDGDALGTTAALVARAAEEGHRVEVLLLSHLPRKYSFIFRDNGILHRDVEKGWPAERFRRSTRSTRCSSPTRARGRSCRGSRSAIAKWPKPEARARPPPDAAGLGRREARRHRRGRGGGGGGGAARRVGASQFDPPIATGAVPRHRQRHRLVPVLQHPPVHDAPRRPADGGRRRHRPHVPAALPERAGRAHRAADAARSSRSSCSRTAGSRRCASARPTSPRRRPNVPDTENLINIPLQIRTVEVSLLFTEPPDGGPIRVSLRSKGGVDVARFAEKFGGGGHARASGLKVNGSSTRRTSGSSARWANGFAVKMNAKAGVHILVPSTKGAAMNPPSRRELLVSSAVVAACAGLTSPRTLWRGRERWREPPPPCATRARDHVVTPASPSPPARSSPPRRSPRSRAGPSTPPPPASRVLVVQ